MTSTQFRANVAASLIRHATGEEYGDGVTVTNVGTGYAEPGYASDAMWVTGDWNGETGSALFTALEGIGVECEWLDEWTECQECFRLVRTAANSYGWQASYAWLEDCGPTCHECLVKYGDDALADYLNDAHKAITWCGPDHLATLGFVRYGEDEYENGWHPGQTDDPAAITATIRETMPEHDIVFLIDSVGQFDMRFSAYVRPARDDD